MKQKDILMILVAVVISGVLSYLISTKFITNPATLQQNVPTVNQISSDFQAPSSKYFNNQSIDPKQLIRIGNNTNLAPFNNTTQ